MSVKGKLNLTVAICTWNHADLLRRTLAQLQQARVPAEVSWELIVVNNNCTDHTDAVIQEFTDALPIRRVFETRPGLSRARNAAVSAAKGEYILWTDDDVLVSSGWLEAYADAIARDPGCDIFGGPIEPWFDGVPPRWLSRGIQAVSGAYAVRDARSTHGPMTIDNLPFGANMVIRREPQVKYPYDPALGRGPGNLLGCEEVQVMSRILSEGARGQWVPSAGVQHFIPRSRQTLSYLWRYSRGNGISAARIAPHRGRFRLFGSPGWVWADAARNLVFWIAGAAIHPPDRWLTHMCTAAASLGRLQGAWTRS